MIISHKAGFAQGQSPNIRGFPHNQKEQKVNKLLNKK